MVRNQVLGTDISSLHSRGDSMNFGYEELYFGYRDFELGQPCREE